MFDLRVNGLEFSFVLEDPGGVDPQGACARAGVRSVLPEWHRGSSSRRPPNGALTHHAAYRPAATEGVEPVTSLGWMNDGLPPVRLLVVEVVKQVLGDLPGDRADLTQ